MTKKFVHSVLPALIVALFVLLCLPAPAFAAGEKISVSVIGPDASKNPSYYAAPVTYELADGEDAWTLTQRSLDDNKLTYDAENSTYGVLLNSITSPADGTVLAYDEASGAYWQLFVDGKASEVGISGVEPADGMEIVWFYSAFGDELPTDLEVPTAAAETAAGETTAPAQGGVPILPIVGVAVVAGVAIALFMRSRNKEA